MGAALWLVARSSDAASQTTVRVTLGLIGLCLAYPFYTHVIGGHAIQLAGNIVTFAVAVTIVARLRARGLAAFFIGAVAAWVGFATVLVFALVSLNGWQT